MSKTADEKERLLSLQSLSFKHCVPACKTEDLNPKFVESLIFAQKMAGEQFVITSGLRPLDWELSHGRKGASSHVKGLAADVSTRDSLTRYKVVIAAALAGIPRIGIGKTFVHLDCDASKPHPIIFHYYDPQET